MTLIAGVDSSTQSCKVVIRDLETGAVVRTGRADHPEGTEVDPEAWWIALNEALSWAGGIEDVAALSVAGQQHGMVVLDAEGQVIRPALLWNDTRSAGAAADLREEFGAAALVERSGLVPVASFTSTKLRWLRDHEPEAAARVAAVCLPHDWLSWRLAGGGALERLATDRSDASGTGYFDSRRDVYDRELLAAALGHGDVVLPRVLGPAETGGVTSGGALVAAGAGDNAAAALGLDARPGDAVVSLGTSGTVFSIADRLVADEAGLVAGFADAAGGWLPLTTTLNAARVLDTTAALLQVDLRELGELALAAPPGSQGLTLMPFFDGERTPNLPEATGTLSGITRGSLRRENLARSAIEGILCSLAAGLEAQRSLGSAPRRIVLIGGAAANRGVQEIAATVFGLPVDVPEPGEYVADGAARQAAWALTGERPSWPVAVTRSIPADDRPAVREAHREALRRGYGVE